MTRPARCARLRPSPASRNRGLACPDRTRPFVCTTASRERLKPSDCRWWFARRAASYIGAGPKEIHKAGRSERLKAVPLISEAARVGAKGGPIATEKGQCPHRVTYTK